MCAVFVTMAFACVATPANAAGTGFIQFQNASGTPVDQYVVPTTMRVAFSGNGGDVYGSFFRYTLTSPGGTVATQDYHVTSFSDVKTYSLTTSSPMGTWTATLRFWDDYSVRWYTLSSDTAMVSTGAVPNVKVDSIGGTPYPAINTQAMTISYTISTNEVSFTQTVTTQLLIDDVVEQTTTISGSSGANSYPYQYSTTAHFGMTVEVITDVYNTLDPETSDADNQMTKDPLVVADGTLSISGASYTVPSTMSIYVTRSYGDSAYGKFRFNLIDSGGTVKKYVEWLTSGSSWVYYSLVSGDRGGYWEATLDWYNSGTGEDYDLGSDRTWVEGATPIGSPHGSVTIPSSSYTYPSTFTTYVEGWDGDGTEGKFVFTLRDSLGSVKTTKEWTSTSTKWAFSSSAAYTLLQTDVGGIWTGELVWYRFANGISYYLASDTTSISYTGVATLTYPADGATGIPTPTTLTWVAPAGANYYMIAVNDGSGAVYYYSSTPSKTLTLSYSTHYWWQVKSSADGGISYGPWTPTWDFITSALQLRISGTVSDIQEDLVPGATVSCAGFTDTTDSNGYYELVLSSAGTYELTVSAYGYVVQERTVYLTSGPIVENFVLMPGFGFYGYVKDETGTPVADVEVTFHRLVDLSPVITSANGVYWFVNNYADLYSAKAYKFGHWQATMLSTYISLTQVIRQDFTVINDFYAEVTRGAILGNVDWTKSRITMTLEENYGATTSVTAALGTPIGSGQVTSTSSFTISHQYNSNPDYEQSSVVLKEKVVITGEYCMSTGEAVSSRVRQWTNFFVPYYDVSDYYTKDYALSTLWDGKVVTDKKWIETVTPQNPVQTGARAKESVTWQWSLGTSVTIYGLTFDFSVTSESTNEESVLLSVYIENLDDENRYYLCYVEGDDSKGGMVLHIWDLGNDEPPVPTKGGKKH